MPINHFLAIMIGIVFKRQVDLNIKWATCFAIFIRGSRDCSNGFGFKL